MNDVLRRVPAPEVARHMHEHPTRVGQARVRRACRISIASYWGCCDRAHRRDDERWTRIAGRTSLVETVRGVTVAFHGATDATDVASFLIASRPVSMCADAMVHRGVLEEYRAIRGRLLHHLSRTRGGGLGRLTFTGHSMGGALAQVAAADLGADACYTFGSPKVGDDAFVRLLERAARETCNVRTELDPVPHFPIGDCYAEAKNTVVLKEPLCVMWQPHSMEAYSRALNEL